jgi:hypothetical protein
MKLLICALFLTCLPVTVQWLTDFQQAKMQAAASKKRILISFSGSDWCIQWR